MSKKNSVKYADDSGSSIRANQNELEAVVQKEVAGQLEWYDKVGLAAEANKSEVLPLKCTINTICVVQGVIEPAKIVKFLGLNLQQNRKLDLEVANRVKKIKKGGSLLS